MKILGIDLGNLLGVCWYQDGVYNYELRVFKGDNIFLDYCEYIGATVKKFKPDMIASCSPIYQPGRIDTFEKQSRKYGALCYVASLINASVTDYKDSHAKSIVLGNGRLKKPDIKKYYANQSIPIDSEDVRDARMFVDCVLMEMGVIPLTEKVKLPKTIK